MTERALKVAMDAAAAGCATMFGGEALMMLPHYGAETAATSGEAKRLATSIRSAEGAIIFRRGIHNSIFGRVKNAIDFLEDTAGDERPYLDGLPVG